MLSFRSLVEIAVVSYEPDDDVKEKKLVTLNSEVIPFYLEKLDDIARDNNGHMANGKVNAKTIEESVHLLILKILLPAHMGRYVLCRHPGLPELHDQVRPRGQSPELAESGRQCHEHRFDQGLDR